MVSQNSVAKIAKLIDSLKIFYKYMTKYVQKSGSGSQYDVGSGLQPNFKRNHFK